MDRERGKVRTGQEGERRDSVSVEERGGESAAVQVVVCRSAASPIVQ